MKKKKFVFFVCVAILFSLPAIAGLFIYLWGLSFLPTQLPTSCSDQYSQEIILLCSLRLQGDDPPSLEPIGFFELYSMLFSRIFSKEPKMFLNVRGENISYWSGFFIFRKVKREREINPFIYRWLRPIFTVWVSRNWTKERALCFILENDYAGHNKAGFANTCQLFFNKKPSELSLQELALIIPIRKSWDEPWRYPTISLEDTNHLIELFNLKNKKNLTVPFLKKLPNSLLPRPPKNLTGKDK